MISIARMVSPRSLIIWAPQIILASGLILVETPSTICWHSFIVMSAPPETFTKSPEDLGIRGDLGGDSFHYLLAILYRDVSAALDDHRGPRRVLYLHVKELRAQ